MNNKKRILRVVVIVLLMGVSVSGVWADQRIESQASISKKTHIADFLSKSGVVDNRVLASKSEFDVICSGDSRLTQLDGYWVSSTFIERLTRIRSWSDAFTEEDSSAASFYIQENVVSFNLNWHEGDSGTKNCVRTDSQNLWASPSWKKGKWLGPYTKTSVRSKEEEIAYFLSKYFDGCFKSDEGEQWCLSPRGITVDKKLLRAKFQMDIAIEVPRYGTAFLDRGRIRPFLIFVPQQDGWSVFEDNWTTSEGYVPINPSKDKPWRQLKR